MSEIVESIEKKPRRKRSKKGIRRPLFYDYFVLEYYLTTDKKQLLRKELYHNAKQVAFCNSDLFFSHNSVYNFMKRSPNTRFKLYRIKLPIHVEKPRLTAECLYNESILGLRKRKK